MSKSKKNTVDPRHIIGTYGADTARLFMLSDSPPERDLEWTEAGVEGAWRYAQTLYRLTANIKAAADSIDEDSSVYVGEKTESLRKKTHKTIHQLTGDIEKFHFNKAVARIRELTNTVSEFANWDSANKARKPDDQIFAFTSKTNASAAIEAVKTALQLIAPMMPHLAEECWAILGNKTLLCLEAWPVANPEFLIEDTVTVAVQVNGKLRATLELAVDTPKEQAEAAALAEEKVQAALEGKSLKKVIVVPNKIVNLVAA
jgi:leucyl-tRNA synthetase